MARQTTMSTTYTLCLESSQTQKTPQSWEAASPVGVHKEMHHGPSFGKWRRNDLFVNTGAACMDEWAEVAFLYSLCALLSPYDMAACQTQNNIF